jgi:metacaspase-1
MSTELDIYKKNRIIEIKRISNAKMSYLYSVLMNNIRALTKYNSKNKQALINSLISKYNNDISTIINNSNVEINKINSYKPEFNVVKINKKTALLVGINYIGTPYELSGCINDANKMKEVLTNYGFNSFKILTDESEIKPTKESILNEFKTMLINAASGDVLLFYFSGHGSYTYDANKDETDGKDEMIISSDLCAVFDDELKQILSLYMKDNVTVFGLFDSCHSGTMFDLKYNYLDSNNYDKYTENDKVSECKGNVIMISGCMDSQTSLECVINDKVQGAMTWSFVETINKTPNITWRELLRSMRDLLRSNACSQIPQLSTDSFYDIDSKVFILN